MQTPVNCQTENIVYYWKCTKENCSVFPQCEYIGLSYEHQYYIKSDKISEHSGQNFSLPGHSLSDMKGLILEEVRSCDHFVLRAREALLIEKFNTHSLGLNKEP